MATLKDLLVKIRADTKDFESGIEQSRRKLGEFGSKATSLGTSLSVGLTAPITAMGAATISAASSFEAGMNKVRAISGATGSDFESLRAMALELGSSTKFSATQAAEGMAFLSMAGFEASETLAAMPGLLSLAAAGGLELGEAADIASNVLSGFGKEAAEARHAADVLALLAARANTDVRQMGEAMSYVAPVAKAVGVSMEGAGALIGKLSDAGIQATRAGTGLRGILTALIAPSKEAAATLEGMGVQVRAADGAMRPLVDILGDLQRAQMGAEEAAAIFGDRHLASAQVLVDVGAPAIRELVAELEKSDGAAKEMADTMNEGAAGAVVALMSAAEGLMIKIGDSGLLAVFTSLTLAVTDIVREMTTLEPNLLAGGAAFAAVLAAAGPVALVVGGIATALATLSAPILGTVAAIAGAAGLVGAFVAWRQEITEFIAGVKAWTSETTVGKAVIEALGAVLKVLGTIIASTVMAPLHLIIGAFGDLFDAAKKVFGFFQGEGKKALAEQRIEALKAAQGTEEHAEAQKELKRELDSVGSSIVASKAKTADLGRQAVDTGRDLVDLGANSKKAQDEINRFNLTLDLSPLKLDGLAQASREAAAAVSELAAEAPIIASGYDASSAALQAIQGFGAAAQTAAIGTDVLHASIVDLGNQQASDALAVIQGASPIMTEVEVAAGKLAKPGKKGALFDVSTAITDLGKAVTDALLGDGNLGERLKGVFDGIVEGAARLLIEDSLKGVVGLFKEWIGLD
ncbi:MAG: phage tail tape measure protein, partial [Rhodospirillaceae bacterium]